MTLTGWILVPLVLGGVVAYPAFSQSITPSPADFLSVREIDGNVQLSPTGALVAAGGSAAARQLASDGPRTPTPNRSVLHDPRTLDGLSAVSTVRYRRLGSTQPLEHV